MGGAVDRDGKPGGAVAEFRDVDIFHLTDGRVTEMWSTSLDPYENDEFWA